MTFSQQIISTRLLQVVIGGQKSSFIGKFKLKPILSSSTSTISYIEFVRTNFDLDPTQEWIQAHVAQTMNL